MTNWWDSLSLVSQIFALIAIPTTGVLLIQTILMLIGIGMDSDVDFDWDIDAGDGIFGDGEIDADIVPTGLY